MKISSKALVAALLLPSALFTTSAAQARPMTAEDLASLKRMGSVSVSPDERTAVFDMTEIDPETYKKSQSIWWLDLKKPAAQPQQIADKATFSEHSPSFSVDGKAIYYLSDASGSEQLWQVPVNGNQLGEPVQASDLKTDIGGYKLSPAGSKVAVWGDIAKACATFGCDKADGGDGNRAEPGPGTGREYEEQFVRHWSSWETPGNYSRIFSFDLQGGKLSGNGVAMDGDLIGDSPSKPFGGGEEVAWLPDDGAIFFTLRVADRDEPKSTNLDIYGTGADGTGTRNFTSGNQATDTMPVFSANGLWLAYAAMARPGYEADRLMVKLRQIGQAEDQTLSIAANWDRSVGSIAWSADSQKLIVTAQEVLDNPAFEIDIRSGVVKRLTGGGSVGNVIPMKDGSIIYTMNSLQEPNDLYRRAANGKISRLTNINATALSAIDQVSVERFQFKGANGDLVWGQIIKPKGTTEKLPMAFLIHGGPQGSFGNGWSTRWNPKVMAAQGYAVVSVDFHGSTGYGQAFTDSINRDWGGKPFEDLKLGYDAALAKDPQIDGERSCALGASYGGYMINWISGNWPDRFDCLVNHAGILDLRSMALSTEELWFDQWDHGGTWTKRPDPEKWNPVNHIEKWQTPTLVIHGEQDFRIPYSQSLMAFNVLQENKVPSKLLIFPDENHWVLKGQNSVQWHRNVFDWLARWIKK